MSPWPGIKASARACREQAESAVGEGATLREIVDAALAQVHADALPWPSQDPLLGGGEARLVAEDDDDPYVLYRDDAGPQRTLFLLAHELGHIHLHEGSFLCLPSDFDVGASEEVIPAARAEPYSPRSLKERQANVWGREFLLPSTALRERHLVGSSSASNLAEAVGLDETLVKRQLARALLTVEPDAPTEPPDVPPLNDRQREAAEAPSGPLLVMAGPGTGKTRTLAGRINYLLDTGVPPRSIVAITFSRKAAEEMRVRLARVRPAEADDVRLDTVHAYCYNVLLEHGPWPKADILDGARQIGLLQRLLPRLPLAHFQYLPDPAARLGDLARAIDRAKCDLIGPEEFAAQAYLDLETAQEGVNRGIALESTLRRAERVVEVAEVYSIYQEEVQRIEHYDYGDLVMGAVRLLGSRPDVLSLERGLGSDDVPKHFLVDEFQDLNVAGAQFVKLLAGDGERLWCVGDPYQAIYRFRGASTSGILGFRDDYPSAKPTVSLDQNYRSKQAVIDYFQGMTPHMHARLDPTPRWRGMRGEDGDVTYHLADTPEAELTGLARLIASESSVPGGAAYKDRVVLARKHTHLAQIAEALEAEDVPVLFLTGFFERDVVRDLLALIELTCERSGRSLLRVSAFPEYAVPPADAFTLIQEAARRGSPFPKALDLATETEGLSNAGRAGLLRLRDHLAGVEYRTFPWPLLTDYLFNTSTYLETYPADDATDRPVLNQRRRVAVFQLLQIAYSYSYSGSSKSPRTAFLDYVRGLARSTEHRQLAQVPEWAAGINAVRLMTVHAAKGLEFEAVHVPMLNMWDFYEGFINERSDIPVALLADDPKRELEAEQQSLFFVAASRARTHLGLSRSLRRYNSKGELSSASPSPALVSVALELPRSLGPPVDWSGPPAVQRLPDSDLVEDKPEYEAVDVEAYLECPRRFGYVQGLALEARTETSAYLALVRCVRAVLREMLRAAEQGENIDVSEHVARVTELWQEQGDPDHYYSAQYLAEAVRRVETASSLLDQDASVAPTELRVDYPKATVRITPDAVVDDGKSTRVQRWTTGTVDWREERRPLYAVLEAGARAAGMPRPIIEAVSIAAGEPKTIRVTPAMHRAVALAVEGMQSGRYPAEPDEHKCPVCPFYFTCQPEIKWAWPSDLSGQAGLAG